MSRAPIVFRVTTELDLPALAKRLEGRLRLGRWEARELRRVFADTFDWRLFTRGARLFHERHGKRRSLVLESPESAREGLGPDHLPQFAREVGQASGSEELAALRQALGKLAGDRRLFSVVQIDSEELCVPVLDSEEKTVARLVFERPRVRPQFGAGVPSGAEHATTGRRRKSWTALPVCLTLSPLRGYEAEAARIRAVVESALDLAPTDEDRFAAALAALDIEPRPRVSGVAVALEPELRTFDAVRRVARALLATLSLNLEGTRKDLDPEFLHDFRVALRRSRSLLTQVKGVFEPRVYERFRGELSWLGDVTGPSRDLDVLSACWPGYAGGLGKGARKELEPLAAEIEQARAEAHAAMTRQLRSKRTKTFFADWDAFLSSPPPEWFGGPRATLPIADVAGERIRKAYRRLLKHGRAIDEHTPTDRVHQLRVDGKKLRYLLEFFESLFDAAEVGAVIASLKGLQDVLGEFNDRVVHAQLLRTFADAGPRSRVLALGELLELLRSQRKAERENFAQRFEGLASKEQRERVERLRPRSSDGTPAPVTEPGV